MNKLFERVLQHKERLLAEEQPVMLYATRDEEGNEEYGGSEAAIANYTGNPEILTEHGGWVPPYIPDTSSTQNTARAGVKTSSQKFNIWPIAAGAAAFLALFFLLPGDKKK